MPSPSRKYSQRIEIWKSTPADNGFGGIEGVESLVKTLWANIQSLSRQKQTEYGLNVSKFAIEVHCRKPQDVLDWEDETYFIKYKSRDYVISEIEDIDFLGIEYRILAGG